MGQALKWHNKFKFLVEIDGFVTAGFMKAGPLEGSVEVIEHDEGGSRLTDKTPGKAKFENITLERGATTNMDEYKWFSKVINAAQNKGGANKGDYERNFSLVEQDNNGVELCRWHIYQAWPVKFTAGEWDSGANEKTIRSIELAIGYFELA